jgi:hypothetical protein
LDLQDLYKIQGELGKIKIVDLATEKSFPGEILIKPKTYGF